MAEGYLQNALAAPTSAVDDFRKLLLGLKNTAAAVPEDLRRLGSGVGEAFNDMATDQVQRNDAFRAGIDPDTGKGAEQLTAPEALGVIGKWALGSAPGGAAPEGALTAGFNLGRAEAPAMGLGARGPLIVYHGSPYDFSKFDLRKIGTGEGAQSYGSGFYFAEHEPVAESYRDGLAQPSSPAELAAQGLRIHGGDTQKLLADLTDPINARFYPPDELQMMQQAADLVRSGGVLPADKPLGHMYQVALHVDPAHLLDWDATLSQQPPAVRDAWTAAMQQHMGRTPQVNMNGFTGAGAYNMLAGGAAGMPGYEPIAASASRALNKAGIPGIQYWDQFSRGAGSGTRNYVMFDPSRIEILRKYGLPLGLGGLGAQQALDTSDGAPAPQTTPPQ